MAGKEIGCTVLELVVRLFLLLPPDHMAVKGGRLEGRLGQQAQCPFWDVGSIALADLQDGGWDVW